jgi:exopolysaccharide transport family protein
LRPAEERILETITLSQDVAREVSLPPAGAASTLTCVNATGGRESEFTPRYYLRILHKRAGTIAVLVAACFVLTLLASLKIPKQYDAAAHIAISKDANNNLRVGEENESGAAFDYSIELDTQVSIIRSNALALQVISDLNLASNPAFNPAATESKNGPMAQPKVTPDIESNLLTIWGNSLSVAKVPRTRMIEIRYTSRDPKLAAAVVNALTDAYVERNFKAKYESTTQATDWLSKQLLDLRLKVETSEQALINYQKANGIVGMDEKQNITTEKLADLNKDLTDVETERMQKQAVYELAKSEPANLPSLANNALFQRLKETEADLERQSAQLSTQFGPAYPKVIEVSNQLKQARASVRNEIDHAVARARIEYGSSLSREQMLRAALNQQKIEAMHLNEHSIQYLHLKREAESNRALYDNLNQKLKEASVTSSLKLSNISVIDTARVPAEPSSPKVRRNCTMAVVVGFVFGIALAFMLDSMDNTVRTPEQVEDSFGLPTLAIIPLSVGKKIPQAALKASTPVVKARTTSSLISTARPKSKLAEAYRALRTSILLSRAGEPPKMLMITSALPQEGKTTTSINTAIVLAQSGAKVLLVDADMRRPSVHDVFGLQNHAGLSTVLAGAHSVSDAISFVPEVSDLYVVTAGPPPPNPAELLASPRMRDLLEQWRTDYNFIVIDTPPVLSVTDAASLSPQVDRVLLVVRSGQTTKEALRRARALFAQLGVSVMGSVVNAVDLTAAHYGYNHSYTYSGDYFDEGAGAEPDAETVS